MGNRRKNDKKSLKRGKIKKEKDKEGGIQDKREVLEKSKEKNQHQFIGKGVGEQSGRIYTQVYVTVQYSVHWAQFVRYTYPAY